MKILLDTDMLIYFLKGHEGIIEHISQFNENEMHTSIINHSELLFGAFNSSKKKYILKKITSFLECIRILPFCEAASLLFAEQKALLKKQGQPLADLDLMIACIAIQNKCTLITNNMRHFSRVKDLKIENWILPNVYEPRSRDIQKSKS